MEKSTPTIENHPAQSLAEEAELKTREVIKVGDHYRYGDWHIYFYAPPIPCRNSDWHFYHDSYDGAPDANDCRAGHAESIEGCLREIADIEEWDDAALIVKAAVSTLTGASQ